MGTINILKEVRQELKADAKEKYRCNNQKYFKEKISCYSIRTPIVRKIAKKYFKQIKHFNFNPPAHKMIGNYLSKNFYTTK